MSESGTVQAIIQWYEDNAEDCYKEAKKQFLFILIVCVVGFIGLLILPAIIAFVDQIALNLEKDGQLPPKTVEQLTSKSAELDSQIEVQKRRKAEIDSALAQIPVEKEALDAETVLLASSFINAEDGFSKLWLNEHFYLDPFTRAKLTRISGEKEEIVSGLRGEFSGRLALAAFKSGDWEEEFFEPADMGAVALVDFAVTQDSDNGAMLLLATDDDYRIGEVAGFEESESIPLPRGTQPSDWFARSMVLDTRGLPYIDGTLASNEVFAYEIVNLDPNETWQKARLDHEAFGAYPETMGMIGPGLASGVWVIGESQRGPGHLLLFCSDGAFSVPAIPEIVNGPAIRVGRDGIYPVIATQTNDRAPPSVLIRNGSDGIVALTLRDGGILSARAFTPPAAFPNDLTEPALWYWQDKLNILAWKTDENIVLAERTEGQDWVLQRIPHRSIGQGNQLQLFDATLARSDRSIHLATSAGIVFPDPYLPAFLKNIEPMLRDVRKSQERMDDLRSELFALQDHLYNSDRAILTDKIDEYLERISALSRIDQLPVEEEALRSELRLVETTMGQLEGTRSVLTDARDDLEVSLRDADALSRAARIGTRIAVVGLLMFLVQIFVNRYRYLQKLSSFYSARANALKLAAATPGGAAEHLSKLSLDVLIDRLSTEAVGFEKSAVQPSQFLMEALKAQPKPKA